MNNHVYLNLTGLRNEATRLITEHVTLSTGLNTLRFFFCTEEETNIPLKKWKKWLFSSLSLIEESRDHVH